MDTWESVFADLSRDARVDEDLLREILDGMRRVGWPDDGSPISPERAWNLVIDFDLALEGGRFGWLRRDGKLLSSSYAMHDRLLRWLGVEHTREAEDMGWARLGPYGYQCPWRLSAAQRRAVKAAGFEVSSAEESQKPFHPDARAAPGPR